MPHVKRAGLSAREYLVVLEEVLEECRDAIALEARLLAGTSVPAYQLDALRALAAQLEKSRGNAERINAVWSDERAPDAS